MKNINQQMGQVYVDYFNEHGESEGYKFALSSNVSVSVLNDLYQQFLKEGAEPLEKISVERKQKYHAASASIYSELGDIIKGIRAIYALSLMTSTE